MKQEDDLYEKIRLLEGENEDLQDKIEDMEEEKAQFTVELEKLISNY